MSEPDQAEAVLLGIPGCAGRMGRAILAEAAGDARFRLAAVAVRPGHDWAGKALSEVLPKIVRDDFSLQITDDAAALFAAAEVVVDFTGAGATRAHAALAAETGTALLVGTTALDDETLAALRAAAKAAPILIAPNTSIGVNLLLRLVAEAAASLGPAFAIDIVDIHHRHKKDAPSGTALALGEALAATRGGRLKDFWDGDCTGGRKTPKDIAITARREGEVPGEHRVIFEGPDERVELRHVAGDRAIFARGALDAAAWLRGRPPGLYGMADVIAARGGPREGS